MHTIETAIARFEAESAASMARKARIETDSRIKFLTAVYAQNTDAITGHGLEGFAQVVDSWGSSRRARKARAETLLGARTAQIDGRDGYLRKCLVKAAGIRREEVQRRRIEECEANFARIDAQLDMMRDDAKAVA